MDDSSHPENSRPRVSAVTLGILAICIAVEGVLQLADYGLIEFRRLRLTAYEYAGFWPGLLGDWRPNYTGQPALMFVSYGFLHTGLAHLAVNMVTLLWLGQSITRHAGEWRYFAIYAGSILGGALGYLALATTPQPMVGASGALFGLAGALLAWEIAERRRHSEPIAPVLWLVFLFVGLNVVLWWAMDGRLAWQTHLGGAIAGIGIATLLPRPVDRPS